MFCLRCANEFGKVVAYPCGRSAHDVGGIDLFTVEGEAIKTLELIKARLLPYQVCEEDETVLEAQLKDAEDWQNYLDDAARYRDGSFTL